MQNLRVPMVPVTVSNQRRIRLSAISFLCQHIQGSQMGELAVCKDQAETFLQKPPALSMQLPSQHMSEHAREGCRHLFAISNVDHGFDDNVERKVSMTMMRRSLYIRCPLIFLQSGRTPLAGHSYNVLKIDAMYEVFREVSFCKCEGIDADLADLLRAVFPEIRHDLTHSQVGEKVGFHIQTVVDSLLQIPQRTAQSSIAV